MIHPLQAVETVLETVQKTGTERISVFESLDRVLAGEVVSRRSLPPMDNSAMDGYAVRHADIAKLPVTLKEAGVIAAGDDIAGITVHPGECWRIMTGAFVPAGADTVVEYEVTEKKGDSITFFEPKKMGANIRPKGEDIAKGDIIRRDGEVVTPFHIARLVSVGVQFFSVYRKPRIALLSTGSEIVDSSVQDDESKIFDSNGALIKAMLTRLGADVTYLGVSPDNPESLKEIFTRAKGFDAVVTSAGISGGDFDYVNRISEELGITWLFQNVNQKPGKPMSYGLMNGTPLFALPGNPVSCMFCAWFYLKPAVLKMAGCTRFRNLPVDVRLAEDHRRKKARIEFDRATLTVEDGIFLARPFKDQGSHIIESMVSANAFMMLDDTYGKEIPAGTVVKAYVYDPQSVLG